LRSTLARWARQLVDPAKIALVVGTVLCLVNGTYTSGVPSKIALNYLVPFIVSSYSRMSLIRKLARQQPPSARVERDP
jgi:hypothetical protein